MRGKMRNTVTVESNSPTYEVGLSVIRWIVLSDIYNETITKDVPLLFNLLIVSHVLGGNLR
jgi:hypothetical protein